mmetsp:Transcript_11849/g.15494  ORF Transcript_11849/g.15494 Transcript_11849/m.15494 type:complete len:276 (-) Transcript_11849:2-829(-)
MEWAFFIRRTSLLYLLAVILNGSKSTHVQEDEYLNEILPGHDEDPRGLPNLPFQVDTNRYTDGVSSISVLGSTSPSFPYYNLSLETDDLPFRREAAYKVEASRAEQGVTYRGAGDFIREEAVEDLLVDKNNRTFSEGFCPAPNTTFTVHANKMWNPSHFAIQDGETYLIEVVGEQYWLDDGIKVDADGYPSFYDAFSRCHVAAGKCRAYLKNARRLADANWMKLICSIGNYVTKLQEVTNELDHYMPLNEEDLIATFFEVGKQTEFTAHQTGSYK